MRRHRQLNSHYFGGRLSEPEIEFADLDEATNGTYGHRKGEPVIKLARALIEGRPFLSNSYATTAATARLAETLQHELCRQAADELYRYPPTGDDVVDHRTFGFRAACVDLGVTPSPHPPVWLRSEAQAMTNPVDQAAARMAAQLDQLDAKGRDLGRLLEPLRPLAGARAGLVVAAAPARR